MAESKDVKAAESGNQQVEHVIVAETRQGFRGGAEVDQTPNENYTVAGVLAGLPVPEAAAVPREARRKAAQPAGE